MKRIKYIFIFAALVVTSCAKEVLDKQPLDIISDNVVWSDPSLVDAYLTECYAETYVFHNVSVDNSWNYLWYGSAGPAAMTINIAGDESKTTWFALQDGVKYGGLTIAGGYFEWWENAYIVIRRLNQFIRRVPDSPLPDDLRILRTAEARFLRAYNFFEMVKRYGGVPLILIDQDADMPEEELYPPRNKEQEVYDFVLSEMDAISGDLPEVGDYSRPTKYAALALKCRAALYAASIAKYGTVQLDGIVGIDASKADGYYQQAYDAAALIIAGGKYELYNKPLMIKLRISGMLSWIRVIRKLFLQLFTTATTEWVMVETDGVMISFSALSRMVGVVEARTVLIWKWQKNLSMLTGVPANLTIMPFNRDCGHQRNYGQIRIHGSMQLYIPRIHSGRAVLFSFIRVLFNPTEQQFRLTVPMRAYLLMETSW